MAQPKFKSGDILYYVNPFVYTIEKIMVCFLDTNNGHQYYVEHEGALLAEWDLFLDLTEAKNHAQALLDKFYLEHTKLIQRANPELEIQEND